jgi:hypothetical protein
VIDALPLYSHLEPIARSLAAQGIGPADPIPPEQLSPLVQWHSHGIEAIAGAAQQLGLGPASNVLAATSQRWNCSRA